MVLVLFKLLVKILEAYVILVFICYCSSFQQRVLWIFVYVRCSEYLRWLRIRDRIPWESILCVEFSFSLLAVKLYPVILISRHWSRGLTVFYLIQAVATCVCTCWGLGSVDGAWSVMTAKCVQTCRENNNVHLMVARILPVAPALWWHTWIQYLTRI